MTSQVAPRENAKITRGRPFAPGNTGRPVGSRNKAALAAEALLEGEIEALTRKVIELALAGDNVALRLCLERVVPPRKDRPVLFAFPEISTPEDFPKATLALLRAVAAGDLTPFEAAALSKLVDAHVRAVEVTDLAERMRLLEEAQAR